MTPTEEASPKSPWTTIWLDPRRTIDDVLATRPRQFIWLLASLGAMAGFYGQLLGSDLAGQLFDWRILLAFVIASAVFGVAGLYLAALVLSWIGRLLGGRASPLELRAVLAWSMVPTIAGSIVVLVLLAVLRVPGVEGLAGTAGLAALLPEIEKIFGLWSLIVLVRMLSRVEQFGLGRAFMVYVLGLCLPLVIAVLVRTFLFQPFDTPSRAMVPTLLDGDHFLVSKYAYGYSHYSLPFSPPIFSGRILGSEPARGDVVVFRSPKDDSINFVKRVVGMPGDRIQMKQGLLYINDKPVTRERLPDFAGADPCGSGPSAPVKRWRETLPNGVTHESLDCVDSGFYDNTNVFTVPEGHFFALGDNRDNSIDSRALSTFGYVPFDNLVGRVGLLYSSRASGPGENAASRRERIGLMVH
jgi:signal peptidase I